MNNAVPLAGGNFLFSTFSFLSSSSLGHFARLAYALDPNASPDQVAYWKKRGIELFIVTDLMFVRKLRERLEKGHLAVSERYRKFMEREHHRIVSTHLKMGQTSEGRMSSAMYQDGLLH